MPHSPIASSPVLVSRMLTGAWRYRHFIGSSIVAEFRQRFARSRVGAGWLILQPLVQCAIYAVVLSEVIAARIGEIKGSYSYAVYLLAGMLCWSLFAEVFQRSIGIFVDNGHLMKKVSFPRICLPLIVMGSAAFNNLMLLAATLVLLVVVDHPITLSILQLALLAPLTMALALGTGMFFGIINTFARDTAQVSGVVLQLLFWATPIVYPASIVPPAVRGMLEVNPVYPLVVAYQDALAFNRFSNPGALVGLALLSAIFIVGALLLYRRAAADIADAL